MITKLAVAFVLGAMYQPSLVQENFGSLTTMQYVQGHVHSRVVVPLNNLKKGYYVQIQVQGQDQGGDIDCALITQQHRIYAVDAAPVNKCEFGFYYDGKPLVLWLTNEGDAPTSYAVRVYQ